FFSSRRRHTRFSRDWSSDVCSSDLAIQHAQRSFEPLGELVVVAAHACEQVDDELDELVDASRVCQLAELFADGFEVFEGLGNFVGCGAHAPASLHTTTQTNKPSYAASATRGRRHRARRTAPFNSIPSRINDSSTLSISTLVAPAASSCSVNRKRPRARRFASTQYPVRSQNKQRTWLRRLLKNTNRCPDIGSRPRACSTAAASPSKLLRR